MNVSLAFKQLTTKQYEFTAKERFMLIVAIGIIVLSITAYMSTSGVKKDTPLPNDHAQKTSNNPNKPAVPIGKQIAQVNSIQQSVRDPFAKTPEVQRQKSDQNLGSPVIHNNVPGTIPGMVPNTIIPSSIPQSDFKLTGIARRENHYLAVIMSGSSSKAYGVNDMIGTYTLTAINSDAVVLTKGNDKVILHLQSVGQKEGKTIEK